MIFFSATQRATVARSSSMLTASTVSPRGPYSRWICWIVEGNSLEQ